VAVRSTRAPRRPQNQTSHSEKFDNPFSLNDPVESDRPQSHEKFCPRTARKTLMKTPSEIRVRSRVWRAIRIPHLEGSWGFQLLFLGL